MLPRLLAALALFSVTPGTIRAEVPALGYVTTMPGNALVLDSRPAALCEKQSLAGARCLSATDFLGPHNRLAGFADIAWVLGSAGLSGAESVLVVGDNPLRRDFVAGLLYIMGQARVSVLSRGLKTLNAPRGPGIARATVRRKIWQAPTRGKAIVFKNEMRDALASRPAPVVLDGRPENAYWGKTVDAARGGHLPGADHYPATSLRADVVRGTALGPNARDAIAYARHAVDGIAYMTLIIAGTGVPVRVYPGGWAEWAADGGLPADAQTFPVPKMIRKGGSQWK